MFLDFLKKIFGTAKDRDIRRLMPLVDDVRGLEPRFSAMTNDTLRMQTALLKERLAAGATLDELLPDAFATVREAAKRVVGMRPFDVQILGGLALHQGKIAEMVTGEGKTLVGVMPMYLNALDGRGVHVVTVNDYLARRDRDWMGPIFEFLGLSAGLIQHDMDTRERQVGYRADITYGTNNEYGFDYLRDNMAHRPELRVQRGRNYAIVDEVDSILIDEARTPLIISGRPEKSSDLYLKVDEAVRRLRQGPHFELEEKGHHVLMSEEGMETAERLLGVQDLYTDDTMGLVHMLEQSLKAHYFYKRDKEYIVDKDGEVLIVDEFTGRAMEGRRYSDGLHQALEAKERVPLRFESQTVATITYQNYFRLYSKLAGMTGTAATEAIEFAKIYNLEVFQVPTNLPLIRADRNDLVFATEKGKFDYVAREIERIHESGRPILVGTVSIEKSEYVSKLLEERGLTDHEVLNAKHHEREASIVANAGKRGAITIATNMAGRGTDIKLAEGVREAGGLYIIGTERHESRRIDNQLRGRCGRQGDPGTTRFYVSLEDEVARLFGGDRVKKMLAMFGSQDGMDAEPLSQRMVSRSIERSQRQVEEFNYEIRKHLLDYDLVMDKQRKYIYAMREEVLEDRDITERLMQMFDNIIADCVDEFAPEKVEPEEWNLDGLQMAMRKFFGYDLDLSGKSDETPMRLEDSLGAQVRKEYHRRERIIAEDIHERFKTEVGSDDSNIDFDAMARKQVHNLELMALLRSVDDKWIEHLYSMDYLRDSVRLRAYGQKDPLLEYKQEGFEMFEDMVRSIEEDVVQTLFRITDPELYGRRAQARQRLQTSQPQEDPFAKLRQYSYVAADKEADSSFASFDNTRFNLAGQASAAQSVEGGGGGGSAERPKRAPVRVAPKVGPNDDCPCGSGKKYKKCCGKQVD